MLLAQIAVIWLLFAIGRPWFAAAIAGLTLIQVKLMATMLTDPRAKAPWYNATGVTLYVLGMLISAFAVAPLEGTF